MSSERTVDWEKLKRCLAALQRDSSAFLGRALLIGGGACWFYRTQLLQANDRDFTPPPLSSQTERLWLSKDIDFTGIVSEDALALLAHHVVRDSHGHRHIEVEGVRFGFAQVGLTIDPEEALSEAQVASFRYGDQLVEFLLIDPVSLYREKQALVQRRNQDNDWLHLSLLREYLPWQVTLRSERFLQERGALPVEEQQQLGKLIVALKRKAPELLRDSRISRRLQPGLREDNLASRFIKEQLEIG